MKRICPDWWAWHTPSISKFWEEVDQEVWSEVTMWIPLIKKFKVHCRYLYQ
jgi:hypothetical protein